MYIVSNKQKIPIQSVDDRSGSSGVKVKESFKLPGLNLEIDPFMMVVIVVLLILIAVLIYLMMTKNASSDVSVPPLSP